MHIVKFWHHSMWIFHDGQVVTADRSRFAVLWLSIVETELAKECDSMEEFELERLFIEQRGVANVTE